MNIQRHKEVIDNFLEFLNNKTEDYVLKGGNSLVSCYGMDRISKDIDLDSINKNAIKNIVEEFCRRKGYTYRIAKDTDTVKRFMINYGDVENPLKIEISYRKKIINDNECIKINNVKVYNIDTIAFMKTNAYLSRDKIRDLYDVVFICKNFWNDLSSERKNQITGAFEYKGLEQFDYLVENSEEIPDDINLDVLAEDFLSIYEKVGLVATEEEKEIGRAKEKSSDDDL